MTECFDYTLLSNKKFTNICTRDLHVLAILSTLEGLSVSGFWCISGLTLRTTGRDQAICSYNRT